MAGHLGAAERLQPAPERLRPAVRQAGARLRPDQGRSPLDRPAGGGVLDGRRQVARALQPGARPGVEAGHQRAVLPGELRAQHVPEQVVVAVPVPDAVERHQEQVAVLEVAQCGAGVVAAEHRVAEVGAEPVEDAGAHEEALLLDGQPPQDVVAQVLREDAPGAVEAAERAAPLGVAAERQRCQVDTRGPPLGALLEQRQLVRWQLDPGGPDDRDGLGRREAELVGSQRQQPALHPQQAPLQVRRRPARQDQLRACRQVVGDHAEHVEGLGGAQQADVVDHQHERRAHRREQPAQPREQGGGHVGLLRERGQHARVGLGHPLQRQDQVGDEHPGVVAALVDGEPRERARVLVVPLRDEGGLPEARGAGDQHHRHVGLLPQDVHEVAADDHVGRQRRPLQHPFRGEEAQRVRALDAAGHQPQVP